jgi:hypothetical protein
MKGRPFAPNLKKRKEAVYGIIRMERDSGSLRSGSRRIDD